MLDPSSISRVDFALDRINTHPEYSRSLTDDLKKSLRIEAEKHSLNLEIAAGKFDYKHFIHEKKKEIEGLSNAWDYLASNPLELYSFSRLGKLVEPSNEVDGFRRKEVRFGSFAPCAPHQVIDYIDSAIGRLNYDTTLHPIQRAADAHIEVVKIHPFEDGNGRVARLLQNFCLAQRGYPAAVIPVTDRGLYINLINAVLKDRFDNASEAHNPSAAESSFVEFLASKVLSSTEHLEEQLKTRRMYNVHIPHLRSPEIAYNAAKRIREINRNKDFLQGITVKVDLRGNSKREEKKKGHGGDLVVKGDLSREDLKSSLFDLSQKYGFQYQIRVLDHLE